MRRARALLNVLAMIATFAFGGMILAAVRASAADGVDVALVLAADVSRSINDDEFALQRRGYAEAIVSPRVLDAIRSGSHAAIAVSFVEWAGEAEQKTVVDWTIIRNDTDAANFAAKLTSTPRSFLGRTAIGSAIDFSSSLLGECGCDTDRRVIDVSGDGTSNQGPAVTESRDAAVKVGIVINGLAIFNKRAAEQGGYLALHTNPPGGLLKYYRENVIGGSGAFALPIEGFDSFAEAMIHKLVSEISERDEGLD
jgi:hypothetical protein